MTPGFAEPPAPIVMTADDTEGPRDGGVTVDATPVGSPSTAIETSPANPPERVTVRLTVCVAPFVTLSVAEESAIAIAGFGLVPLSLPPLHAASVAAATIAVMSLVTASIPRRTLPPDTMNR